MVSSIVLNVTRKLIIVSIFTPFYQQKRLNRMICTPIGILHTSKKLSYFKMWKDNLKTVDQQLVETLEPFLVYLTSFFTFPVKIQ